MPCYEVRRMSVEFKAENKDLLIQALKALKWRVDVRSDGKVNIDGGSIVLDLDAGKAELDEYNQGRLNQLKRQYSMEAINQVAKKNLWMNKAATDKLSGVFVKF